MAAIGVKKPRRLASVFQLSERDTAFYRLSQRRRRWGAASSGCSLPISLASLSTLCRTDARASDVAFSRSADPLEEAGGRPPPRRGVGPPPHPLFAPPPLPPRTPPPPSPPSCLGAALGSALRSVPLALRFRRNTRQKAAGTIRGQADRVDQLTQVSELDAISQNGPR